MNKIKLMLTALLGAVSGSGIASSHPVKTECREIPFKQYELKECTDNPPVNGSSFPVIDEPPSNDGKTTPDEGGDYIS